MQQCVVAVYPSRTGAEQACAELQKAGVPSDHMRLSKGDGASGETARGYQPSFWDWLFGTDVPEDDRRLYQSRIAQGHTALSVYMDGSPSIAPSTVENILDRCGATDLHVEGQSASGSLATPSQPLSGSRQATGQPMARAGEKERVIPLPEEELKVGKQATEQVHRIKTYVVEKPVQKDVNLHDERVTIEKRRATTQTAGQPMEREYEVREHHEEPVVQKQTKAGEELVVRREANDRTEHIQDTVRQTRADVKKEQPRR
jgi:stress response protein YsnF